MEEGGRETSNFLSNWRNVVKLLLWKTEKTDTISLPFLLFQLLLFTPD